MKYEPGNVIALDDGKEYIIVYKINVANKPKNNPKGIPITPRIEAS